MSVLRDHAGEPNAGIALATGLAGEGGIPRIGRAFEHELLRDAGADDLAWGRLYEGHVNALQLIARLGTEQQRLRAQDDVARGRLFGVWNTQAADGVRVAMLDASGVTLTGRKTFASGAGRVARALITVAWPDGAAQLVIVPMDRVRTAIDPTFWRPYGMETSDSFAVDFNGVRVTADDVLGEPNDYERSPWLQAGASRFVAVQAGGIARLVSDFGAFLRRRGAAEDPIQLTRLGESAIASRSAQLWVDACVDAWMRYDGLPAAASEQHLLATVDAARSAVERCALDVAERIERGAGARGLLETEPFAVRLRDLRMYLRQPAIDATLIRVGESALPPSDTA